MTITGPAAEPRPISGYTHLMIRVTCPVGVDPDSITGMVERLGTGEKQRFGSGQELLVLVNAWCWGQDTPPTTETGR